VSSWIGLIEAQPVVPDDELHALDRDVPRFTPVGPVKARSVATAKELFLDAFHATVPIKVLEDFDVQVSRVMLAAENRRVPALSLLTETDAFRESLRDRVRVIALGRRLRLPEEFFCRTTEVDCGVRVRIGWGLIGYDGDRDAVVAARLEDPDAVGMDMVLEYGDQRTFPLDEIHDINALIDLAEAVEHRAEDIPPGEPFEAPPDPEDEEE
jgi:hypothetical protein